jgi:hypothetical protein
VKPAGITKPGWHPSPYSGESTKCRFLLRRRPLFNGMIFFAIEVPAFSQERLVLDVHGSAPRHHDIEHLGMSGHCRLPAFGASERTVQLEPRRARVSSSIVKPEVFEALAVVDAVGLGNEALDLRVIAVGGSRVEEDRAANRRRPASFRSPTPCACASRALQDTGIAERIWPWRTKLAQRNLRGPRSLGPPFISTRPVEGRERNAGEFLRPNGLLRPGRYRIEFALALLDPTRADVALYCDADMVRTIARTCRV